MGKTIEVRLNDAQYAALVAEADASDQKFFEHCRTKLVANMTTAPVIQQGRPKQPMAVAIPAQRRAAPAPAADDRIARIEDAVARLTDYVMGPAEPSPEPQRTEPLDINSIVDAQLAQAEAAGLTEMAPDPAEEEMQHSGVRAISRRPVPFSGANTPRHLQQLLG